MEMTYPELAERKNRRGTRKDPVTRKKTHFEILDEILRRQSNAPHKLLCLQRVKMENGTIELRLGYYIIGKRPRMKGKWTWGQYAPFIPVIDFMQLIEEAEKRSWLTAR